MLEAILCIFGFMALMIFCLVFHEKFFEWIDNLINRIG